MLVNVRLRDASVLSVTVADSDTVLDLKAAIETAHASRGACPPALQKLVYKGKILKDTDTLAAAGGYLI